MDKPSQAATTEVSEGGPVLAAPFIFQIELTNHCPYACIGCPRTNHMGRPLGFMAGSVFRQCLEAVPRDQKALGTLVWLHHFGESLLHPEIGGLVAAARDRGVKTALSCNPGCMTRAKADALLSAGLDQIVFSVDGMDDETLKAVRGLSADFHQAQARLEQFLARRTELGATCAVTVQMVAYAANRHQRAEFIRRWQRPDVEAVIKGFDSFVFPGLRPHGEFSMSRRCLAAYYSVVVLWDGRIVPCCHDVDGGVIFGNIADGIDGAWTSSVATRFRRALANKEAEAIGLCRDCSWWPPVDPADASGAVARMIACAAGPRHDRPRR